MKLKKARPALVQVPNRNHVEILLKMNAVTVLISMINATRSAHVFARMFVMRQK